MSTKYLLYMLEPRHLKTRQDVRHTPWTARVRDLITTNSEYRLECMKWSAETPELSVGWSRPEGSLRKEGELEQLLEGQAAADPGHR